MRAFLKNKNKYSFFFRKKNNNNTKMNSQNNIINISLKDKIIEYLIYSLKIYSSRSNKNIDELFIKKICNYPEIEEECIIICIYYLDKLNTTEDKDNIEDMYNDYNLFILCLILISCKYWDDYSLINKDFSIISQYPLEEINECELKILFNIQFKLLISEEHYRTTLQKITNQYISSNEQNIFEEIAII
jgi:hypothetical protein